MVSFINKGRCGNFLFQAAACVGYAYTHGLEYSMPSTTQNVFWNPIYLQHLVNAAFEPDRPKIVIPEQQHRYHHIKHNPTMHSSNIFLDGYWQSYMYFDFCREHLLRAFGFPYHFEPGTVAVHVRRGDYLMYPKINPLATRAYYEKAVKHFWLKGFKHFRVFSDDIEWCATEFTDTVYQGLDFSFVRDGGILQDMAAMSCCEHMIMSNSTYAWWGAWLNRNPDKIIVCPHEENYYGPDNKHLDVSTLYPPKWVRIKY